MPKPQNTVVERSAESWYEVWITVGLMIVAIVAATIEYGRDMGLVVFMVLLGFTIYVRLFLGIGTLVGGLRGASAIREIVISGGLCASALMLHWLSPFPLGRVAVFAAVVSGLYSLAKWLMSRAGG